MTGGGTQEMDEQGQGDVADKLWKLAELFERGLLTEAEFAAQKAILLGAPIQATEVQATTAPATAETPPPAPSPAASTPPDATTNPPTVAASALPAPPPSSTPPGWYLDPADHALARYWNGRTWSVETVPAPSPEQASGPPPPPPPSSAPAAVANGAPPSGWSRRGPLVLGALGAMLVAGVVAAILAAPKSHSPSASRARHDETTTTSVATTDTSQPATSPGGGVDSSSTTSTTLPSSSTTDATGSTTTSTLAANPLAIGQSVNFTKSGAPYFSISLVQVADPTQASNSFVKPASGNRFVAFQFTVTSTGTSSVVEDIFLDLKLYDSTAQHFPADIGTPTAGASFPPGGVNLAPGATTTGWVMFQLPANDPISQVVFTPAGGAAQVSGIWDVTH